MADEQPERMVPRRRPVPVAHDEDHDSIHSSRSLPPESVIGNNDHVLIDNPLLRWSPNETERRARQFARDYDLRNQEDVLVKAAKILRDPEAWQSVPNLTPEEKQALASERKGFWQQPKQLRVTIITLCVAAMVQGWNQTASNGANLQWPGQLGLDNLRSDKVSCQPTGPQSWIFAIVNAAPYLAASLIGCWLSDPISETFLGRRAPICLSGVIIFASIVGSALTSTWRELLGCRVLLGVGMGLKAAVVPVFAAEVAPAHIRGSLVMNWQLFDALGICLGFTANLAVSPLGASTWRWQTASSVLPTIVLLTLIFVCPESPRFLMKCGKYKKAYKTLVGLRGEGVVAAKELVYVHFQGEVERALLQPRGASEAEEGNRGSEIDGESVHSEKGGPSTTQQRRKGLTYWQKLAQLFTNRRVRRAMLAAVVCMVGQQMCGVNVLAFYSSTFFCDSSISADGSESEGDRRRVLFLSWGIGLCNFLFAFPAYYLIDRKGRRWLLLIALPFLAITMLAAALSFLIPRDNGAHAPVVAFWTYLFMVFYSWSMGPVPFTLSAEVFPLESRQVGMSFAVFTNLLGAGLLTLFVPALTLSLGHTGLLAIFAALNVVAFVLVFLFVPETAGAALGGTPGSMTFMSLEELNYIFGVSTRKHVHWQVRVVVPWAWKKFVKRERGVGNGPGKLYVWATAGDVSPAAGEEVEVVGERL